MYQAGDAAADVRDQLRMVIIWLHTHQLNIQEMDDDKTKFRWDRWGRETLQTFTYVGWAIKVDSDKKTHFQGKIVCITKRSRPRFVRIRDNHILLVHRSTETTLWPALFDLSVTLTFDSERPRAVAYRMEPVGPEDKAGRKIQSRSEKTTGKHTNWFGIRFKAQMTSCEVKGIRLWFDFALDVQNTQKQNKYKTKVEVSLVLRKWRLMRLEAPVFPTVREDKHTDTRRKVIPNVFLTPGDRNRLRVSWSEGRSGDGSCVGCEMVLDRFRSWMELRLNLLHLCRICGSQKPEGAFFFPFTPRSLICMSVKLPVREHSLQTYTF